ncbi:inositol monophosphatase [Mesorhizobium sp. J428]|uniref:inositol monophosphatase family protein n=1 Tax=Mesorhizobium sp. J428 TaxID=2898440 RepID=UPI002151C619|nr:inositol monophosphatase [Mesorhizobium sp. J428]MCR5859672.1 inositol monophosphatase [Mesorhizobium sp. J428]
MSEFPDTKDLAEIERVAVELASLAGAEITNALGGILAVKYKGEAEAEQMWRDPVSEVDQRVEEMIRARLASKFPDHGIIGEEFEPAEATGSSGFVWAVDPVDGTTNFVNGFPLCAASIGVLCKGVPVVGAVWCGTSQALRPGVYHASAGGPLRFGTDEIVPKANPAVRRRLAGVPRPIPGRGGWETRKTGSAALECAFVAAGILEAARFESPNIWDVAAGLALLDASDAVVLTEKDGTWEPFETFAEQGVADPFTAMRTWRRPLMIGRVESEMLTSGFEVLAAAE